MVTLLLFILTTALGAVIGHYGWDQTALGAVIGFLVAFCIRFGLVDDGLDVFDGD